MPDLVGTFISALTGIAATVWALLVLQRVRRELRSERVLRILAEHGGGSTTMFTFGSKSKARLTGVHPDLVLVVSRGLLYSKHDFAVSEGMRSVERQEILVSEGKSLTLQSKHLRQKDGFSHAIDLVAAGDLDGDGDVDAQDTRLVWDPDIYRDISAAMQQAAGELNVGIKWGGDFKRRNGLPFFDGPHFELV